MNKKGIDLKALTFLFALIFCAILLVAIYVWFGAFGARTEGKIMVDSAEVNKNHVLIDLLNSPLDEGRTIGDALAYGELDKACSRAKMVLQTLYGTDVKYVLSFDDDEFCESSEDPSRPVLLTSYIPTRDNEIKEVNLEI